MGTCCLFLYPAFPGGPQADRDQYSIMVPDLMTNWLMLIVLAVRYSIPDDAAAEGSTLMHGQTREGYRTKRRVPFLPLSGFGGGRGCMAKTDKKLVFCPR